MKKISIISICDNTNFGTYLQIYALATAIRKSGGMPELVNYLRPFMTCRGRLLSALRSTRNPAKKLKRLLQTYRSVRLRQKDYKFVGKSFHWTREYNSSEELSANPPKADIYMTGSDQVWNTIHNRGLDKAFYLDFAPLGKHKVAYSASIGMKEIPKEYEVETKELLSNYTLLSVREAQAKELLVSMGVTKVEHTLDPTLLLNKDEWSHVLETHSYGKKESYLLLYSVEEKKQKNIIEQIATRIAHARNLKVYAVYYGGAYNKFSCSDKDFFYADVPTFLELISGADFVVVSSFHGTAFSINFNKPFYTVSPNRFNSRVESLLNLFGLNDRLVSDPNDIANISDIDYTMVNKTMDMERTKSYEYIKRILSL